MEVRPARGGDALDWRGPPSDHAPIGLRLRRIRWWCWPRLLCQCDRAMAPGESMAQSKSVAAGAGDADGRYPLALAWRWRGERPPPGARPTLGVLVCQVPCPLVRPAAIAARLRAAGCVFAEEEARLLIAAAPGPAGPRGHGRAAVGGCPRICDRLAEFCGLRISIDPGVFVPRHRSEFLVSQATAALRQRVAARPLLWLGALGAPWPPPLDPSSWHAATSTRPPLRCLPSAPGRKIRWSRLPRRPLRPAAPCAAAGTGAVGAWCDRQRAQLGFDVRPDSKPFDERHARR